MYQAKCSTCHQTFQASHKGRKYCTHKCYTDSCKNRVAHNNTQQERSCAECKRQFYAALSSQQKFCSKSCFYSNRKGSKPWNQLEKISKLCVTCGKEIRIRPNSEQIFCSKVCSSKHKSLTRGAEHPLYNKVNRSCEHCGSSFLAKPAKVAMGEARFCSRQCVGAYSSALQGGRRSSIEVAIEAELVRKGVSFESQKPFRWYTVDFYLPHLRLVIECDGDYWHSRPQQAAKDQRKDAWLGKHGEKVVRLSETEIRRNPSAALARALAG